MHFEDYISDFYQYMVTDGGLTPKTSHDYISRLKFLAERYELNNALTADHVRHILEQERTNRESREVYASRKAISDLSSGLKKFLAFIQSDYHKHLEDSIICELNRIKQSPTMTETEKEAIILARVGQGRYRKALINYWHCCSVSGFHSTWMLMASHIKPWRYADNRERLDVYNGLLLLPNLDKLFDKGYMSFDEKGHVIYSTLLTKDERKALHLTDDMHLTRIASEHLPYLRYHRERCLL